MGVAIADRLPMKLNIPPVSPSSRSGASADTGDHVIDASPLPKDAMDRNTITIAVESVKLAPIIATSATGPR
jgi:hypothetical protein